MRLTDGYNDHDTELAVNPSAQTDATDIVGNIIDTANHGSVQFEIFTGTLAATTATFAFKLYAGDVANMSDETEVTAASELIGSLPTITQANDNATYKAGYIGKKRYLRLKATVTSNDAAAPLAAIAILGGKRVKP